MLNILQFIRYVVAYVFIASGIMKIISVELGQYFLSLGLPYPIYFKYVVVILEIGCGIIILLNKRVKFATIPLIAIMIGAILLTKIPLLHTSFMEFAFQARLDIVMLVLLFILYNHYHRNY